MKKIITLTTCLLIALTSMATVKDSSDLSERIYTDAKKALVQLGQSLKVGSEHVYGILVKQQIVSAIIWLIVLLIGMLFAIPVVIVDKTDVKSKYGHMTGWENSTKGITSILLLIIGAIIFFIGIGNLDVIVTGFINPEYGAMKEIMRLMR